MSPPLKVSVFDFRIGYGFNYSTSKESRYVSTKPINEIKANWDTVKVSGIYNPYFTPEKQTVHSVILSITIHPVKTLDIGFKGNIGVYSTASNPFLYKDSIAPVKVARGFSILRFYPIDASAFIALQITPAVNLKADYGYQHNNFYTNQYAGLSLTIILQNEKKRK
jgi:hypothetical protein